MYMCDIKHDSEFLNIGLLHRNYSGFHLIELLLIKLSGLINRSPIK